MCKKRLVLLRRAPRSKRARFARRLLTEWVDWQHSSVHPLSLPPGSEAGGGNPSPGGEGRRSKHVGYRNWSEFSKRESFDSSSLVWQIDDSF